MKKKIIIIVSIILIIMLIVMAVIFSRSSSDDVNDIILKNDFKLKQKTLKGTIANNYTYEADCYQYEKGKIAAFIYDYDTEEEAKNEMQKLYEEEKQGTLPVEYSEEENYIIKNTCSSDVFICTKVISFKNYVVFFYHPNEEKLKKQTEEIIKSLLAVSEKYVE